jgi:DNA helicase-2/ATP-dependent DNA helicase PcrA
MSHHFDFSDLEPSKVRAIKTTEDPLLIIAAPGSGKTRTLIERILYLFVEKDIAPENILVATFTEKAASELITRVTNRLLELNLQVNVNDMYIGTLHSIFLRLIEDYHEYSRLNKNYRILDDFEQNYFVYGYLREFEKISDMDTLLERKHVWKKTTFLVESFNKLKEEMVDLIELQKDPDIQLQALAKATILYNKLLEQANALDFSGIQSELLSIIENHQNVLEFIQKKILYLMVDEYQDTNTIQEKILLKIANRHQRICVVGDDDQSLYRFRGATVQNILSFRKNFPPGMCKLEKLETNFRSHPDIIQFYSHWMRQIPGNWEGDNGELFRYEKLIRPADREFMDYPSVVKIGGEDNTDSWHNEIFKFLQTMIANGQITDYNQVAFLFRSVTNEKVKELANFLESKNIPVYAPRSGQFFEREEIQLLLGALLVIFANWKDYVQLPNGYELEIWAYYDVCRTTFSTKVKENLAKHKNLLQFCFTEAKFFNPLIGNTKKTLSHLFYELLQFPMFAEILDVDLSAGVGDQRAAFNLSTFSQLVVKFEYLECIDVLTEKRYQSVIRRFLNNYIRFLKLGGIAEYEGFEEYAPSGNVSFMTIHQSKGLEFPVVVVGSLSNVPRKQHTALDERLQDDYYRREAFEPLDQTKIFDFWRLYYTAFSRAQNLLVLTAIEKQGTGSDPSKYFRLLYSQLKQWSSVNLDRMPVTNIKATNLKGVYSFTSDVLLYENCPLQYKYFRALEFSQIRHGAVMFGVLVHQTIEDIHKAVLRGELQKVNSEQIETWFNLNYQTLSKTLRTYLNNPQLSDALLQVKSYVKRQQNSWDRIKEAEVDVSLVKDEYILRGKIDLVRGESETIEIVDFKTGKKPDVNNPEDRKVLDRYRRQLEIYGHLVKHRYGIDVNKMHVYYTQEKEGIPTISWNYSDQTVDKSVREFGAIVHKIESNNYNMDAIKKTKKLCENCDMQFYCNHRVE